MSQAGISRRLAKKIKKELTTHTHQTEPTAEEPLKKTTSVQKTAEATSDDDQVVPVSETAKPADFVDQQIQKHPEKKSVETEPEPVIPLIDRDGQRHLFASLTTIDDNIEEQLYEHGFKTIDSLRTTSARQIAKKADIPKKLAKQIKKEIKKQDADIEKRLEQSIREKKEAESALSTHPDEFQPDSRDISFEEAQSIDEKIATYEPTEPKISGETEEWETVPMQDEVTTASDKEAVPYTHGEYTLYRKEITMQNGKTRTLHFFSKSTPADAEAVSLPDGFEVKVNKKTKLPYLRKKKK